MELIEYLNDNLDNNKDEASPFPEHEFIAGALKAGLKLSDLKYLSYVDVAKIMISYMPTKKKKANQKDIDRLLG